MSLWFVSDNHFGHKNIIKYSNRPYSSVEEMDEQMIQAHNAVVRDKDVVWFLGDFAFARWERIAAIGERLNGEKHLVYGNHDDEIKKALGLVFPPDDYPTSPWKSHQDYKEIKWNGQKIVLFHFGQRVWNKSHHGSWHLYGHSHGDLPPLGKSVDVGVDAKWIHDEYRPTHIDEIAKFMKDREIQAHHAQ